MYNKGRKIRKSLNGSGRRDRKVVEKQYLYETTNNKLKLSGIPVDLEHGCNVSRLCEGIGVKLGLPDEARFSLMQEGLYHDRGKNWMDPEILFKKGPLTEVEMKMIKGHPSLGAEYYLEVSRKVSYNIACHHERWDGSGYPLGLKGEEIPLGARILAVADAYDAMTTDRPYRKRMKTRKALDELRENAGTQFDPEIVAVFVELIEYDCFILQGSTASVWQKILAGIRKLKGYSMKKLEKLLLHRKEWKFNRLFE